jgi:branched-chain amino acid transport system ATP-binding protein
MNNARDIGDVLLKVEDISLSFGGVQALSDVTFEVHAREVLGIIGPNGAGKSSMLNVINGFYHPDEGRITYQGTTRTEMRPHEAARQGIARTFQNIALFKGMSTLDNIMTGRNTMMHRNFLWQALYLGPARAEELEHRGAVERIIDFLEIEAIRKTPVGRLPYGLQKRVELGRALAAEPELLLLDEPMAGMNLEEKEDMCRFILDVNDGREGGHVPVHPRRQRRVRHHHRLDRTRHGRGDGHLRPGRRARLRAQDRRRLARPGAGRPGRRRRLSGGEP